METTLAERIEAFRRSGEQMLREADLLLAQARLSDAVRSCGLPPPPAVEPLIEIAVDDFA